MNLSHQLKERSENKIIIGDFNLTLNIELDRENTYCNNNKAKEEVENIIDEFCLEDTWRVRNGDKREYSWIKKHAFPHKASRIDFALISKGLDQKVEMIQYTSSVFTDHRALYAMLELDPFERGKGYWKFNSSLLHKPEFVDLMNKEIVSTIQASVDKTPIERWENLKDRIKKVSRKFANQNSAKDRLIIAQLSEIVDNYESRLPLNQEEDRLLTNTRLDLEEKTFERIKGVMFRSKANWIEQGEKNTKYFFSLEKAKYNAKTCYKLKDDQDKEYTSPQEILAIPKDFYTKLYQKDEFVKFDLQNTDQLYVPEDIKIQQDQQITMQELQQAIKDMKNNKTPGEDGIPIDFYKVFWQHLKDLFYEVMIECFSNNKLHDTAQQGILNLIPKPNKDSRFIKNLRPITLLNTDYKIIEKAIANKMMPALEHIIHHDQRGFMKDRRISVNIRKILDIIQEAKKEDLGAVILSLDFVQCFDKCSFDILFGSLDYFKFGDIVKQWTRILYKDYTVKIQNNGHFSQPIQINKGVHQGGCCSSVYFLVIAEILAISLRSNKDIEGINIKGIRNLLNQFADDMDISSLCNKESLENIFNKLEAFRLQSGFTVSYEKTTLYRIGSLRHSDAKMYDLDQFAWSNQDITVLGVTIAHEDLVPLMVVWWNRIVQGCWC